MKSSDRRLKPCVLIGGGGHAWSLLDAFHDGLRFRPVAVLDSDRSLWNSCINGVPVVGDDSRLPSLSADGVRHFVVGLGGIGDNRPRRRLFDHTRNRGFLPASVIHRTAFAAPSARIAEGAQLLAGVLVGARAEIEENAILNTGSIVEHDCRVKAHAHVATGAILCGGVTVGIGAHIGAGAVVIQGIKIGDWAMVGAGAVVIRNVRPHSVVAGVPARILPSAASPGTRRQA